MFRNLEICTCLPQRSYIPFMVLWRPPKLKMQFLVARKWPSFKGGKGHFCKAGGAEGGSFSPFLSEQNSPAGLAIPGTVRISSEAAVGTRFAIEFTAMHGELHQPFGSAHKQFLLLKGQRKNTAMQLFVTPWSLQPPFPTNSGQKRWGAVGNWGSRKGR